MRRRARISILTCVADDPDVATQVGGLPIEIMLEGITKQVLSEGGVPLRGHPGSNISLQHSEKGSYREEHMYAFLDHWLPPLNDARKNATDWRILMMDSYKAHMSLRIRNLCWQRGYLVIFLRGHITGVLQVNDTDLHAPFKRIYESLEIARFSRKLLADPGDIAATRQEVTCGNIASVDPACVIPCLLGWCLCVGPSDVPWLIA